ncbi:hypothetical protein LEM8419_03326 [Neolewinella maritima]|uniref:DUF4145 domain-containing protein n=2 Tax=Neolewinella maritima TaxID=1383882 RepID=A0ABM9B4X9_9BACT|nr:hypothetical protein LEM8419_03326 [Neolewinella maritima]
MKKTIVSLECVVCLRVSKMAILDTMSYYEEEEYDEDAEHTFSWGTIFNLCKCRGCNCLNVFYYDWDDTMMPEIDKPRYQAIYPVKSKVPIGLPKKISIAFQAAYKVKRIDVNAYVVLIRRMLEMVCLDKEANGNTLASMLNDLASRSILPDELASIAKYLKNFGNIGAHAGIGELSNDEIPIVENLSLAILEYIYSAPKLVEIAVNSMEKVKK